MKKITAVILILLTIVFASCGNGGADTTSVLPDTAQSTSADTATETEAETEPLPEEDLKASDAVFADGFTIGKKRVEQITEKSGEYTVNTGDKKYEITYESRFFGAESMVNRDSHHMGDLFVSAKYSIEYPVDTGYVFGEFTNDRFSEYVTYTDGVLRIYKGKGAKARYKNETLLFSEKIDAKASLRGTGDYNGDGFADILFVGEYLTAFIGYGSENGFDYRPAGRLDGAGKYENTDFYCGDMNGDGIADIIGVKGVDTCTWILNEGEVRLYAEKKLNIADGYECCCVADLNTDGICDLVVYLGEKRIRTYYGQKDGQFGPHEDEVGNINLYPTWDGDVTVSYMTVGDMNEDGVDDIIGTMMRKNAETCIVSLNYPTEAPAYDYSTHLIKNGDGTYTLYNGGLYVDYNKDKYNPTDGDHVLVYNSDDGVHWHRNLDAPAFYLGGELGVSGEWWCGNTIEPEVVYVDGTYYMYWQCENYTHLEDGTLIGHDKIGVATSKDGLHFERKTDVPVIKNEPDYSSFDHEEVIYVEDDADGLPFWLYVRHVVRNVTSKIIRLRSADPTCFDFATAQEVNGWNAFGNQTGWIKLDDGSRLFVRINFIQRGAVTVPMLQFSGDGINWRGSHIVLASQDPDDPIIANNTNCYFLGFSTVNGTGEIEKLPDGRYKFVYGTCTSKSPVAPAIFYSSIGGGECTFSITIQ